MKRASYKTRHPKKEAFLEAFRMTGVVSTAAKQAGVERHAHYEWLERDETYRRAFESALETAKDNLEIEARRRAVAGIRRPVLYKGQQVVINGVPLFEHAYSDTMLIVLMKRYGMFRDDGVAVVTGERVLSQEEVLAIYARSVSAPTPREVAASEIATPKSGTRESHNGNGKK